MRRTVLCAALVASAFVGATDPAWAEEAQMRVNLADLNLGTSSGAAEALGRIRHQAAVFCESNMSRRSLEIAAYVDKCYASMTRKSVDQLGAPLVTALLRDGQAPAQSAGIALAAR